MGYDTRALHRIGAYHEAAAPPALAHIIDVAWVHRAPPSRVTAYPGYLVAPEPAISLCFACQRDAEGNVDDPELLLIGPVRVSRAYLPFPGRCMAAVRIHPEWSRTVLHVDPRDHGDALDDYTVALPRHGRALLDALRDTRSTGQALACLFDFVGRQTSSRRPGGTDLLVHRGLQRLRRAPRPDGLRKVAAHLRISTRHFRRVVGEASGLAPRDYARLERFRGVLRDADATDRPRWSDLAALHGYADQPHLAREVRRVCGLTPRRLHAERRRHAPVAAA